MTATAATTTNVPLCLLAILGAPLGLLLLAGLLGFFPLRFPSRTRPLLRQLVRQLELWQDRRQRRRLRRFDRSRVDEGRFVARVAAMVEGAPFAEQLSQREEYVAFVHALAAMVGPLLAGRLGLLAWSDFWSDFLISWNDSLMEARFELSLIFGEDVVGARSSPRAVPVAGATTAQLLGTPNSRLLALTAVIVMYSESDLSFVLSATGLPVVMAWFAHTGVIEMFSRHPTARDWAISRGYCRAGPTHGGFAGTDSVTNDNTCTTMGLDDGKIGYLATFAVAMDRACLLLLLLLMAAALDRLLAISESVLSLLVESSSIWPRHGPSSKHAPLARVYRIATRFDIRQLAEEYRYTIRDQPDHTELEQTARSMFQLLSRRGSSGGSDVAIWLGDGPLCACNHRVPPYLTGWGPADGGVIILESVGTVVGSGAFPSLHLYRMADRNEPLAAAMDTFFHLLAIFKYQCGPTEDWSLKFTKGRSVAGPFPVSRKGLAALVRRQAGNDGGPPHRRTYELHELNLSPDQWNCIFRSCEGPDAELLFRCSDHDQFPEAFRALIRALKGDRCLARISVVGLQRLPEATLLDLMIALEMNRSVTELAISVGRGGGKALSRLLDFLANRRSRMDVLRLRVSEFTADTWRQLWRSVVPSRELDLKKLDLRTGRSSGGYVPDEGLIVRSLSASTTLCEFDYYPRHYSSPEEISALANVLPNLSFNRVRRLVLQIEAEPCVALQKRWFATVVIQSAATSSSRRPSPAWCYHLLLKNAGNILEHFLEPGRIGP